MIDKIKKYIDKITESEIAISKSKQATQKLPLYITESVLVYDFILFGNNVVLLYQKNGINNTPNQLSKIENIVKRTLDTIVLFAFDSIESYNKQRLINKRINFVVQDKQLFIPALLIDLSNKDNTEPKEINSLTPLAQLIILYHLQIKNINAYTTKEIASLLDSSYITTSRAIKSLEVLQIIELDDTKERKINFIHSGNELWLECLKHLKSPVKCVVYTDDVIPLDKAKQAHINALAHYTMMAEDRGMQYAMTLEKLKSLGIKTDAKFGEHRVEIWKYNPDILSCGDYVDRLSLFLSLKDNTDDRVQIELEQLIDSIKW